MSSFGWLFVETTAQLLTGDQREAVLGDLVEAGESAWQGLLGILGLVVRMQAGFWKSWRPWLAAFGVSFPASLLLMGVSLSVSQGYQRLISPTHTSGSAFLALTCQVLRLLGWSWIAGFVVGSLSRKTLWMSAVLCCSPCLFCLLRFRALPLSRFCLLLFLLPAIWGVCLGLRGARIHLSRAIVYALALLALMALASAPSMKAATTPSKVVSREIQSVNFAQSRIGVNPARRMVVYLPAGYGESQQRYPVLYFFPDAFASYSNLFDHKDAQSLFDRAIAAGMIDKFILVAVDMNTPLGSSWCVNSPATGNWDNFVIQELRPYIDANFKTLPNRDSRGIAGEFMGGYCAISLGMRHPDVFGAVYGMHPVGTGSGLKVMLSLPNWDLMAHAKTLDDVRKDGSSSIFATIFEAFLPDPQKPPLYIDLAAHKDGDQLIIDTTLEERVRANFFLESMIPQYAANLKSLRGLKFDWGRSDLNQDHVYANQAFTHKLNEFGIAHEAEEYNGTWGDKTWGDDGRIYNQVLPFFKKHLVFAVSTADGN